MTLTHPHNKSGTRQKFARALLAFTLLFGFGVAAGAWYSHGPQIFMTLANSALAWCF